MTERKSVGEASLSDAVDGRTRAVRRFHRLVRAFAEDLGGGQLSHADTALVRSAAALTVRAEQAQEALLTGEAITDEDLVRLSNAAARILNMLGAQRIKRKPVHIPLRELIPMEREQNKGKAK
jgi:hypothetical protein